MTRVVLYPSMILKVYKQHYTLYCYYFGRQEDLSFSLYMEGGDKKNLNNLMKLI